MNGCGIVICCICALALCCLSWGVLLAQLGKYGWVTYTTIAMLSLCSSPPPALFLASSLTTMVFLNNNRTCVSMGWVLVNGSECLKCWYVLFFILVMLQLFFFFRFDDTSDASMISIRHPASMEQVRGDDPEHITCWYVFFFYPCNIAANFFQVRWHLTSTISIHHLASMEWVCADDSQHIKCWYVFFFILATS